MVQRFTAIDQVGQVQHVLQDALRLREGFELARFTERTGLPLSAAEGALLKGEQRGLIGRDLARVWPTPRGFDFLSDLQALFL